MAPFPPAAGGEARYLRWNDVAPAVGQLPGVPSASEWEAWIRATDAGIRARVLRGWEDSVTNLLAYGTTFTRQPRLEEPSQIDSAAGRARLRDLAGLLSGDAVSDRLRIAQEVLRSKGRSPAEIERALRTNVLRYAKEQKGFQARLDELGREQDTGARLAGQSTLYAERGLSVDTSLPIDWALEDTLGALIGKGAAPASVGSAAILGPGLDFADKRDGFDQYPLQTVQPFAILDALLRLGLAGRPEVVCFDLNPAVVKFINGLRTRAAGVALRLARRPGDGWLPPLVAYWQRFGENLGELRTGANTHQVRVQAVWPRRISATSLNVVAQTLDGAGFDLVVATNILVYYDRLQQALAMSSISRLLAPGGLFLSNTVLPAQRPAELEFLGRRSVRYTARGDGDDIVVYRKRS